MKMKGLRNAARAVCAVVLAGSMFAVGGCDMADSLLAVVRTSAQSAIQDAADDVIQNAVDGILGDVLPDGNGG
jgi:hypothetical protein